jgi:hypothetical protein
VKDNRNQRKNQQQMDEKACDVKHNKAADPRQKQHDAQYKKHVILFSRFMPNEGQNRTHE